MTVTTVIAASASDMVAKALNILCEETDVERYGQPAWSEVGPRGMATREVKWTWYCLTDVERCACWLPGRKLNYPFMFAEFLWMFCGRDDVAMIAHYNENIRQFSDDGARFYGAYGPPWRGQVGGVVERLTKDPDSRQAVVGVWRPMYNVADVCDDDGKDFPGGPRMPQTRDVPCTLSMQYLIRDGKLEAGVVMRSSDAWLGLPYDIFNFAMLQRAVAAELKVGLGALTLFAGSSHLYERDIVRARAVLVAYDDMQQADGCDAETDYRRSRLVVPGPPGIAHGRVSEAEEVNRINAANPLVGLDLCTVDGEGPWVALLTMLAHRKRRDPAMVHRSVRPLLGGA